MRRRVVCYAEAGWDESEHPRDEKGRFAFTSKHAKGESPSYFARGELNGKPFGDATSKFTDPQGKTHGHGDGFSYCAAIIKAKSDDFDNHFATLVDDLGAETEGFSSLPDGVELVVEDFGEYATRTAKLMGHAIERATSQWGMDEKQQKRIATAIEAVNTAIDESLGEVLVAAEEAFEDLEEDDKPMELIAPAVDLAKSRVSDAVWELFNAAQDVDAEIEAKTETDAAEEREFVQDGIDELSSLVDDGESMEDQESRAIWWNLHLEEIGNPYRIALADDDTWWYWNQDELEDWPGKDD